MGKINVFEPHIERDFDVFFQNDATLETKVDVRYLKYSVDEIDKYINQSVKPDLDEYVAGEKSKLISYYLDLNNNILSLEGSEVTTSAVDLNELSFADKYVTLVDGQNIDAVKTFTQNPVISKNETPTLEVQNTSVLFGSAPEDDQVSGVNFTDSTGTVLGSIQHKVCADTNVVSVMSCSNLEASESSEIAIGYDKNGDVYTKAPTPLSGDNSTKIATTAFVEQVKQALAADIALKEDIISDLITIRNGAALGATAVQPASLATVATTGSYTDLSNKPTIPTVNNATLTIQKNGTTVNTFTANASSNVTANITVPTKTSDITNDSGYITGINSSDVTTALGFTPAKTDLSNLTTSATTNIDGQWVISGTDMVSSNTNLSGQTTYEYSLSSYLPDDSNIYEVLFSCDGATGGSSGNGVEIGVGSSVVDVDSYRVAKAVTRTSSTAWWCGSGIMPIGTDRKIKIRQIVNTTCQCSHFRCLAYRRVGTNS